MAKKCRSCGGGLEEIAFGKYRCPYCGSDYTEGDIAGGGKTTDLETFSLLTKAREAIELEYNFMNSLKFSQSVLEKNPASQEANWLAMLAENQIAYIANDAGKYTPTFLAPETGSLKDSPHYGAFNEEYKRNADEIENMRVATLDEMKKLKPYDVFISYRQHGPDGAETKESKWAWELYTELKSDPRTRDLNIFFDQKSLTGSNAGWEPHIFSAIHTSKCMILLGSSLENINSRWVKNEWKRFLAYKKRGEKKEIVVLGGDAVNPLLLDDGLQEKQMISNTSGRWVENVLSRVSQACGKKKVAPMSAKSTQENAKPASKPAPEPAPKPAPAPAYTPPAAVHEGLSPKVKKIIIAAVVIVVFLIVAFIVGSLTGNGDEDTELGNDVGAGSSEIPATATFQGLKLGDTESGYAIVGNDGTLTGSVELPAEHDGKKITLIADGAFDGCSSVTSLTVPDSVTQIDAGAFEGLTKLENLTIPFVGKTAEAEKFEAVLGYPFGYETVVGTEERDGLGDDQEFVDEQPASVQLVGTKTAQYAGMTRVAFVSRHTTTFYFYAIPKSLKEVTVTNQKSIPIAAFRNMEYLEKVTYEEDIETFKGYSFELCTSLTSFNSSEANTIDLTGSFRELGDYAFCSCKNITKIVFGNRMQRIGKSAFANFANMTEVTVPDTVTEIDLGAFEGCNKISKITLPFVGKSEAAERYEAVLGFLFGYETVADTEEREGSGSEQDFVDEEPSLTQVVGTKTAQYAGMTKVAYVSRHTTTFYFYAIPSTLKEVTITKQEVVPLAAFRNMEFLEKVTFQANITTFKGYAFQRCEALTAFNSDVDKTIDVSGLYLMLGEHAFDGCAKIEQVVFSQNIRSIGAYAFKGLNKMTEFSVPDGVTEINVGVLEGCNALRSVTVPFVGKSASATRYEAVFGFIFGYETFKDTVERDGLGDDQDFVDEEPTPEQLIGTKTSQYAGMTRVAYVSRHTTTFYFYGIPASLTTITISKQSTIPTAAFRNLANVTTVNYKQDVTETGTAAFNGCGAETFTKIS